MPKDVYYFKHDSTASQDTKLKALRKRYGWAGCGWFWYLIELMRSEENYKLDYNELMFESLATDFICEPKESKAFIDYCIDIKLLSKNGVGFYSERLTRDMKEYQSTIEKRKTAGLISGKVRQLNSPNFNNFSNTSSTHDEHMMNTSSTHDEQTLSDKNKGNEAENEHMLNTSQTDVELLNKSKEDNIREDNINNTSTDNRNIFEIFEQEGFGMISPSSSEILKDIENTYPKEWILPAFKESVRQSVRSLAYVTAILKRWQRDGFQMNKQNKQNITTISPSGKTRRYVN